MLIYSVKGVGFVRMRSENRWALHAFLWGAVGAAVGGVLGARSGDFTVELLASLLGTAVFSAIGWQLAERSQRSRRSPAGSNTLRAGRG